ncbi:C5a anaphylatoxin chemotactic receptor 1 [Silurus asotus]|uniref:C5a anaphylatoxin chemotactic receptor 1 n=1 Tax=Silurus asotus TaxID=30991 RepID=A0AAD5AYB9_SILAS|nr:C5a anaphylatoxin chemotactic receptor 1 [Silurus asotus]
MYEAALQKKRDRLPFQIFPDPVEVIVCPEGTLGCVVPGKERLPSIVVEPTDINEVESGELRWPPEHEDSEDEDLFLEQCIPPANIADWGEENEAENESMTSNQPSNSLLGKMSDDILFDDFNYTDYNCSDPEGCSIDDLDLEVNVLGWRHWFLLTFYAIVFLLGVPGNSLVVWVTAFRMPRSVNAQWFLNLSLADLLCCLTMPLLMVQLAHDLHWPFGSLACKILPSLLYMVMYSSVLLLTVISLDRWLLVTRPAWCQNRRQPRLARWVCLGTWVLAFIATIPQLFHMQLEIKGTKVLCIGYYSSHLHAWAMVMFRFLLGFLLQFLIISYSHWAVYKTTCQRSAHRNNERSARTLRVILAVVVTFFLCWLPLHIVDIFFLVLKKTGDTRANLYLAHTLALCLAYINSCLNPLLYVCLGRGFRESLTKTLKSVLNFASEEPTRATSVTMNTKSTTDATS